MIKQPKNIRSRNNETSNQQYSETMIEDKYDTDEFEIHEESDEEEEEEDEENKKLRKKKQNNSINNSSSKKQVLQANTNKNSRKKTTNPEIQSDQQQLKNQYEYENSLNDESKKDGENIFEQINGLKQKNSLKSQRREDSTKQQKENDLNSSNESNNQLGSVENIKIPMSNEDQIQKKIRDKYFKKTIHKPFVTQQLTQSTQMKQKTNFNSQNSHTVPSQTFISTGSGSNGNQSSSNNNGNYNQNQGLPCSKINQTNTQGQLQQNMNCSSNLNSGTHGQQQNYNYTANMSSIQTKIAASYQPSSTGHNFYSQNPQNNNTNNAIQANSSNGPNAYLYSGTNAQNRKANRSQSPLHTFKRQSNLGHSQQRRLSKEMAEPNSPEENQIMRTTFNNTTKKFKINQNNQNQITNNYDALNGINNGAQSFENHIAFRNSFYNKGNPLNSLPNSNFVGFGCNSNISNNVANNTNSKQRLTINDFYKNQSKYDCYDQPTRGGGFHMQNNGDYLADVMMMRRTAKENKFLNQKDKIQEMVKEDANYITKHAARFNINPSECKY